MLRKKVEIVNKLGLHARAAAKFVGTAGRFESQIEVMHQERCVNGKSIMGVMMLAACKGNEIELIVSGPDQDAALEALVELIAMKFNEAE
jgi:phosphocarrier protein HPr